MTGNSRSEAGAGTKKRKVMDYYNGVLCISGKELIRSEQNPAGIMSLPTYKKLAYTKKKLRILRPGKGEGHPALIAFDSLPPKYKDMAKSIADPVVEAQRQKIEDCFEIDSVAVIFFKRHIVEYEDNSKKLPDEVQELYVMNASILNAIKKAWDDHIVGMRGIKKRPMSGTFWKNAVESLKQQKKKWTFKLPGNPIRLRQRLEQYEQEGYNCLIDGNWANKNTAKITPESGEWLVARWSSRIKIVTLEQLYAEYNQKAEQEGWKKLKSSVTIREYLFRPEVKERWYAARHGELSYKEVYIRQHKTILPVRRDTLWYSDGTKLNFYYQDKDGKTKTCQVYEVMDVYSEYFLGYHISQSEDFEAQYHAFKMAIQTSQAKPYELKYDNQGGHKKLENSDLLKNLSRHAIRTAPYNGRSKTIESAFGRYQADYLHEEWYFTGQNITAKKKESRGNMEFILANLKNLPTLEEAMASYKKHREKWNNDPHPKTGISRGEMYRTSINDETQKVDILDMIAMFGITTKEASTYRSSGIQITVKKKLYEYEVLNVEGMPDTAWMRRNINRKFYVRYTPEDMDIVSLYEKDATGMMRFITFAQPYIKVHRALQDHEEGDMKFIRYMEMVNKLQRISNAKESNELLERYNLHPNQHGLNVAKPKGLNMRKKPVDIGEMQKEVSNITALEEEKKAARRTEKRAQKVTQKQSEKDNYEFDRKMMELLQSKLN